MSINKDDIFRTIIGIVLSLLAFIGMQIRCEQADMLARLRVLELQNARIMERLGIIETTESVDKMPIYSSIEQTPMNQ